MASGLQGSPSLTLRLHRNLKRGCRAAFESDKPPEGVTDTPDDLEFGGQSAPFLSRERL